MNYIEETALFACEGDTLLGILARPETPAETGVLVVVGGPQYRVGSHRQFLLLSRTLAAAGYPVLRFDYRGMGDSEGAQRDFQAVNADIAAAMDVLHERVPSVTRVVLWGLCDGASAALLYCHATQDTRVSSLCLLNPWVRSETSLARTQLKHYYLQRAMRKEFWRKLFRGGVALEALAGLARNVRVAFSSATDAGAGASGAMPSAEFLQPFQHRMAAAWSAFHGGIFLLLSGDDYTAKEFLEYASKDAVWKNALAHPHLVCHDLPGADHTFSSPVASAVVAELTLGWLEHHAMQPKA